MQVQTDRNKLLVRQTCRTPFVELHLPPVIPVAACTAATGQPCSMALAYLQLLCSLLDALLLLVLELKAFLRDVHQLLALILRQLPRAPLVNGLREVQHLHVLLDEVLDEGRVGRELLGLGGNVVNRALRVFHARDVVVQAREHLA